MRKLLCALAIFGAQVMGHAQGPVNLVDSFKVKLAKAKTAAERVEMLGNLSLVSSNNSVAEADEWGKKMTAEAEMSRDRRLIVKALLINGQRYGFMASRREYLDKSIAYYKEGLEEARKEKLDTEMAAAYISLSAAYLAAPDYDQAARNAQQALSVSSGIDDDSLKAVALNANGDVYQARKERLFALRFYLNALRLAESNKNHLVMRSCYSKLSHFYASLEEYDKAIDYAQKSMDQLVFSHQGGEVYNRVMDICGMGNLYIRKKGWDMSQLYFEKALALADSLRYPPMKIPAYNGLLNLYIESHQPAKALSYFKETPDLGAFAGKFGLGYVIDMAYGVIYTDLGRYDSARVYFERAGPFYEHAKNQAAILFRLRRVFQAIGAAGGINRAA
jgi:tetratricopeptide (TPR) repeat protein